MNRPTLQTLGLLTAITVLASGCGELVSAAGSSGNVVYSIQTNYEVDVPSLTEATLITGHMQTIHCDLTAGGFFDTLLEPVTHEVLPREGISFSSRDIGLFDAPSLDLMVDTPGMYTITTYAGNTRLDTIDLSFDTPASIRLNPKVRAPHADEFIDVPQDGLISVKEGAQMTFVPEPLDALGDTMIGEFDARFSFEPEWAVVPGQNINGAYTDGWWSLTGPSNFYVIEAPADQTLTVTANDSVNNTDGVATFLVEPVDIFAQ